MYYFLPLLVVFFFLGCGDSSTTVETTSQTKKIDNKNTTEEVVSIAYSYIPKDIDYALATRFLNKATFGATKESIEELQSLGAVAWVEKQLDLPIQRDIYLGTMISIAKQAEPDANPATIEEYLALNDTVFNKEKASFHSPRYRLSAWFNVALHAPDQIHHRVTYALSQIIVESDFEPIFLRRAEALARYFDVLYHNSMGSYKTLLEEISFNSGMGLFLTFNGNQKLYYNDAGVAVYPDENYAREIMQLFSIGLNKLNLDGTPIKDAKGNLIPTYTQNDVNALARVFTGWDLQSNSRFGLIGFTRGDLTHPLEFTSEYHDDGEKKVLGESIPAGLSGAEDIKAAVAIIMNQPSVAPFISKQLIMRLVKSNPSPAYIQRVATVFQETQGDLKAVTKAILLDEELWDDLQNDTIVKFKEPVIAFTQFLRAMHTQPFPKWYFCGYSGPEDENASNCTVVENSYLFNDPRDYLAQGPGLAPNVFNFYDNDYIPNDPNFKVAPTYAPEAQIQSDTMLINYSNEIYSILTHWEKGYILESTYTDSDGNKQQYTSLEEFFTLAPAVGNVPMYYIGADKMLLDMQEEYDLMEMIIDGDTDGDFENLQPSSDDEYSDDEKALWVLIEFENQKLTAGRLTQAEKQVIFDAVSELIYNQYNGNTKKYQIYTNAIVPVIRMIVTSDAYMVE